jgi:hypothetical protein
MKKRIFILALCIGVVAALSVIAIPGGILPLGISQKGHPGDNSKHFVMMKDGKMMIVTGKLSTPLEKEMTMHDGSKVMPDGTLVKANGDRVTLKDGDRVYMDGKLKHKGKGK